MGKCNHALVFGADIPVRDESKNFGGYLVDWGEPVLQGPDQAEDLKSVLLEVINLNTTEVSHHSRNRFATDLDLIETDTLDAEILASVIWYDAFQCSGFTSLQTPRPTVFSSQRVNFEICKLLDCWWRWTLIVQTQDPSGPQRLEGVLDYCLQDQERVV